MNNVVINNEESREDSKRRGLLLRDITRSYARLQQAAVDCCHGVSQAQCRILTTLDRSGPVTLSGLSRATGLDKGWVSRIVEVLSREGLVIKEANPSDRRSILLRLSEDGRAQAGTINRLLDGQATRVLGRIPETERGAVIRSLELLLEAVQVEREAFRCPAPEA